MFCLFGGFVCNRIIEKLHPPIRLNVRRTSISNFKQPNRCRSRFVQQFFNKILFLRYSYFAAIGGSSNDGPPPCLLAPEVSQILRTNQITIKVTDYEPIKKIECNQLASNNPIEDRLRVARLKFDAFSQATKNKSELKDVFLFSVLDGHGGETCADLVADRLYTYLAAALYNLKTNQKLIEPVSIDYLRNLPLDKFKQMKKKVLFDEIVMPKLFNAKSSSYRAHHLEVLEEVVVEEEKNNLIRFVEQLEKQPVQSVEDAISKSFIQCDLDMSDEIKRNIMHPKSNIVEHFYLSLAASGCCVNLILIDGQEGYVASTGDCKAVQCINDSQLQVNRLVNLSIEHDSDNINEIRRLMRDHPKEEQNTILKNNRLLGRLMPLRAFGDFSYKWSVDEMQLFLTRAFGPHIVPPHYKSPPYLIVDPEITKFLLPNKADSNEESFIILATDGLWEQFANVDQITKTVTKHKLKLRRNQDESDIFDRNSATYLLRNALGQTHLKDYDSNVLTEEIVKQQHERLVSFLTLPQAVVRNFRDDITIIVIHF